MPAVDTVRGPPAIGVMSLIVGTPVTGLLKLSVTLLNRAASIPTSVSVPSGPLICRAPVGSSVTV